MRRIDIMWFIVATITLLSAHHHQTYAQIFGPMGCGSGLQIAPSPTQLWHTTTYTTPVFSDGFNPLFYAILPVANVTVLSSPIVMSTLNGHLTRSFSQCSNPLESQYKSKDCWAAVLYWVPAELQLSVACSSITYAIDQKRDTRALYVLANVLVTPEGVDRLFENLDESSCTVVNSQSEIDSCLDEWNSGYEELYDMREPSNGVNDSTPVKAKWCFPCRFITRMTPGWTAYTGSVYTPASEFKTCSVNLIPDNPLFSEDIRLHRGIDLFFFPPSEDSRDMCATVPSLSYHSMASIPNGRSNITHITSSTLLKSAVTLGKTMYEGTVYMRFSSIGAFKPLSNSQGLIIPLFVTPREAVHTDLWIEIKPDELSTLRWPGMWPSSLFRSYQANLGDLVEPHPYSAWKVQPDLAYNKDYLNQLQPTLKADAWPWGVAPVSICPQLDVKLRTGSKLTTAYATQFLPYMRKNALFGEALNLNGDYFRPVFKVPPQVLDVDPAWKNCRLQPYVPAKRIITLVPQEPTVVPNAGSFISITATASPKAHIANLIPQQTPVRQLYN